ncbi:MAG TPA: translation elongation factor Ts [Clostridiaceae bacterium]|nr:translation elongation factor Ts [Clostridiaceae bacterium]
MATITAQMVKELRNMTGAGMMDSKQALQAAEGDIEKAIVWLREKGMATAEKKSGRIAAEGIVDSYLHGEGRVGVLIEVNIETDFAARNQDFKQLVRDLAMQVAAMKPLYLKESEIPESVLETERQIARNQALADGKPEKVVDRIVEGRVKKYIEEFCLMNQAFIKDESKTCEQVVKEMIAAIGENISVRRFTRYEMGEGLEKKEDDFAAEVAAQLKG